MTLNEFRFSYNQKSFLEKAGEMNLFVGEYQNAMDFCRKIAFMAERKIEIRMLLTRKFNTENELEFIVKSLLQYTDWDEKKQFRVKELIKTIFRH